MYINDYVVFTKSDNINAHNTIVILMYNMYKLLLNLPQWNL